VLTRSLGIASDCVPVAQRTPFILRSVRSEHRYTYFLSLPERVVRSLGALSGGLLNEIGKVVLPAGVRRTTLYRTMVEVALRFLIEEVGQVEGIYPSEGRLAENFLLQRTTSHGIELLGILAFHASPIWVLAALADASGGGRKLVREIAGALKEEGLLDKQTRFETMEQVLTGLESTSRHLAETINVPPLNIAGLRREWNQLKQEVATIPLAKLPRIERVEQVWLNIQNSAQQQGRSVFVVSSLLAISTIAHVPARMLWLSRAARSSVRHTGKVVGDTILTHYVDALAEIERTGIANYWKREFRPYLLGAAEQFAPDHPSLTERWLGRRSKIR
jgi:plasmid maintenance system antidote protein VapI